MEARFQVIESKMRTQKDHQTGIDRQLFQLEQHTTTIDDNITAMMVHWKINPQKCKADTELQENKEHNLTSLLNEHNTAALGASGTSSHTSPYNMDVRDMEE